ncbi:MAG: HD-GYP domain-containing protein [Erysipelotrichaceae bacterium]|nr:HD-GYP domain-containing protein [Erysipelotrichaceae bacterium]
MEKYGLIKSFIIYSMIAFILTGIILSQITYSHIRKDDLSNIVEIATVSTKSIVKNNLEKVDFGQVFSASKVQEIESNLNEFMSAFSIESITVLNNKREIVMSTGEWPFSVEEKQNKLNLDKIINHSLPYIVSDAFVANESASTKSNITYFNFFITVYYENGVEGVFVLRMPSKSISAHADLLTQEIALALTGGLLLLFLLLIGLLYKTSKTLINQNEHLNMRKNEVEESYKRLDDSYKSTVIAMSNAVDARDSYTAGHSNRVSEISILLGQELGLSDTDLKNLHYATLFHDIGKIGISDSILNKNGKLSNVEYEIIKEHPDIGVKILKGIDFLADALTIIRHHHERFDGGGYPCGLKGEEIPLGSRIIAIADTYDAMTSNRPYRLGINHELALSKIIENKGSQFDSKLIDVFLMLEKRIYTQKQTNMLIDRVEKLL